MYKSKKICLTCNKNIEKLLTGFQWYVFPMQPMAINYYFVYVAPGRNAYPRTKDNVMLSCFGWCLIGSLPSSPVQAPGLLIFCAVMVCSIGGLASFHTFLCCTGQTTREDLKRVDDDKVCFWLGLQHLRRCPGRGPLIAEITSVFRVKS